MANDFSGDGNVVALYLFEENLNDTSGNGNNLTSRAGPSYSGDCQEGSFSSDWRDNLNESAYRADADLSAGFPGKSGVGDIDFSVVFWLKRDETGGLEHFVDKYEYTAGNYRCFDIFQSGDSLIFKISDGTNTDAVTYDTSITSGVWYHVGATYDASESLLSLRVWDSGAGAFLNALNPTQSSVSTVNLAGSQSVFELATTDNGDTSEDFDGHLDEVVVFTRCLTDAEIDSIRSGAYPAAATLTVQDTVHGHLSDVILQSRTRDITVQSTIHNSLSDVISAVRTRALTIQDAIHDHLAEVSQLSKAMTLIVQDTVHGHLSDAVLATRDRSLTTQGAIHDQLASVSALARDRTLAAQSTIHDHLADVSTVTRGGVISLTLQDTIHGHLSHVADVDRDRGLHVQDTVHGQLATVASLSKGLVLELQDAVHGHICDAVAPSRERTVNLQEPVHGQFADSVTLLLIKQLTTQDSIHGQLADVPLLSAVIGLTVQSSIHSSLSSVPSVNIASTLTIQNSIHGQFVSRPSLSVGVRYPQRIWQAAYSTFNFVAKDSTYTSTASNMNYINIAKEDK